MITLDASVLIAYLDARDAAHDRASALLKSLAEDTWCMSALTLAEVLVLPTRLGRAPIVMEIVHKLEIQTAAIPADAAASLAQLRASTGLRMPDCCVLLTAVQNGTALATFDAALAKAAQAHDVRVLD